MHIAWILFILLVGVALGGTVIQLINERKLADQRVWAAMDQAQRDAANDTIEKQRQDIAFLETLTDNLGRMLSNVLSGKLDDQLKNLAERLDNLIDRPDGDEVFDTETPATVAEAEAILREQGMNPQPVDEN